LKEEERNLKIKRNQVIALSVFHWEKKWNPYYEICNGPFPN
jgi:hypothetical protein